MVELQHRFTVPAPLEDTWAHFNDIESVAGCFPGAVVTESDEQSFHGTVKVKLGPIALVYNGTGTFVEKDEGARRMVIDARGKDKRGNGTAGAMVTATMSEAGPSATDVEVLTDLNITGKAAQFGRGNVMKDVSDKLLGQFVACLEQRMQSPQEAPQESADAGAPGDAAAPAPPEEESAPTAPPGGTTPAPAPVAAAPARTPPPQGDDSLDLGAAVLPVLARAYWKPAAAVVAAVLLVWWWVSRG